MPVSQGLPMAPTADSRQSLNRPRPTRWEVTMPVSEYADRAPSRPTTMPGPVIGDLDAVQQSIGESAGVS